MPFVLLYKVQITLKQKIGLAAVFGLATIIIITAIVRAIEVTTKARIDVLLLSLWSIIESTIGRSDCLLYKLKKWVSLTECPSFI